MISPVAVGGLAFVTAVVAGFGTVVIGNDLGMVLADASANRSEVWRPLLIFLCLPLSVIVGASAVATVTGSRRPASIMASAAVGFGTLVGVTSGRLVWQYIEIQTYGEVRGLLDTTALLVVAGSILAGGVAGALVGDQFGAHPQAKRISQWSNIVATALLTYAAMELIAGREKVGAQQLWMLGFMLLALGLAPRIGLILAEGDDDDERVANERFSGLHAQRDHSASVRLLVGFAAGWMTSMLVNMTGQTFDGQLFRYLIAWTLPLLLAAPGILAHFDRLESTDLVDAVCAAKPYTHS
ncbi:MAG: hypothetical protein ACN4GZ_01700 [Acidimicrobiales bacterium]